MKFSVSFNFKAERKIARLRFDPDNKNLLSVKINKFTVNGETVKDFMANCIQVEDGYFYFLTDDPSFIINKSFPAGEIDIEISGTVKKSVPPLIQNFEDMLLNKIKSGDPLQKYKKRFLTKILKTR